MDDIFQAGAALRAGKLYVERPADAELFDALARREFCHVLAPRQIGKTSLCHRAMRRLEEQEGARCALIEVLSMGTKTATVEQWYRTFAERLTTQLKLSVDLSAFWQRHGEQAPVERWTLLLREEARPREGAPVVIVVDEIDALLSRPELGDEFFGAVRAFANARATTAAYEHLTFCLVGVCSPSDLISDKLVTPYNISSRAIRLEDFSRAELDAFAGHIEGIAGDPRALLDGIFSFTEGHPYLTQALFVGLRDRDRVFTSAPPVSARKQADAPPLTEAERIKAVVQDKFLHPLDGRDPNLAYAEERFKASEGGPEGAAILRLYRRLLDGDRVAAKSDDPHQMALRLAGMAAERRGDEGVVLRVRNLIFASVFDRAWVKEREAKRLVTDPLTRWQENGKRDDFLPEGEALDAALAWAKGSDDLSPEECRFLVAAVERSGHRRLERTELTKTVDLERSFRMRAEMETQGEVLVGKLRDQLGRERRRALIALASAAMVLVVMIGIKVLDTRQLREISAAMDSDRAALQATLQRQREELARSSDQLDHRLRAARSEVQQRERESDAARERADALERKATDALTAADRATANRADLQRRARQAISDADLARKAAEEAKALAAAAKQSAQEMSDRYDGVKRQAEDAERRAKEAAANEKRTKELADAAVQSERELRVKAEADLTAEQAMSASERKLRITAEAERRACQEAKQRLERELLDCPPKAQPFGPFSFPPRIP